MGRLDVESFLQNGYWQNTRATSPDPSLYNTSAPVRTTYVDPAAPRRLPFRVEELRQLPPPPSVEDEVQSLAREYGSPTSTVPDEEPSNRGEVEQHPILLEVHEHNPERRFVIVPGSSEPSSDDSGTEKRKTHHRRTKSSVPRTETYEANTGRKYDNHVPSSRARGSDRKHEEASLRDKRRSKLDGLPAIVTDSSPVADVRSRDIRKARSTTAVEHTGEDYFSPKESSRSHVESMLSPDVVKHSTRGKDRPYWDGGSSPNTHRTNNRPAYLKDQRSSAYEPRDSRRSDSRHKSNSPTLERRSTLDLPTQTKRSSKDSYDTRARRDTETHSPKLDRKDSSRSYVRPQRDPLSRRAASYRDSRDSPTFNSSEDEARRYGEVRRRRRSLVREDRRDYLETHIESSGRSKSRSGRSSRHPSPDPTLRGSQSPLYHRYGSSHPRSSTFPKESKTSSDEDRSERPLSRASTARSTISSAASIVIPAVISAATSVATDISSQSDHRKPDLPPLPPKHEIWPERSSTASNLSSTPSSSKPQQSWPPRLEAPPPPPPPHQQQPRQNGAQASSKPIVSYRRYSEDVKSGAELPDLPECPRTREEAGHVDWLTFPRCDNFNVCPSCFDAAFAGTPEFAHSFVPAPFRPLDQPLACDFGRSPWYQVAWLLTRKARMADLSLLRGVAAALARAPQPCDGFRETYRVWYSIPTASATATVPGFNVCQACARAVEAVLPNLTGIFVPVGAPMPAEPRLGVCSMHHQGPSSSSLGDGGASCGDRFVAYLSAMETAADEALAAGRAPDVQALADRIAHIAAVPECRRGVPVRDARWYIMRSIPELTVCEACFGEVVTPLLVEQQQRGDERDGGPSVAGDFHYRPQRLPVAACQLYSGRMRDAFLRAARRRDLRLLESKFRERRAREQEYYSQVAALDRQRQHGYDPEWVAREAERLLHEWQAWE